MNDKYIMREDDHDVGRGGGQESGQEPGDYCDSWDPSDDMRGWEVFGGDNKARQ